MKRDLARRTGVINYHRKFRWWRSHWGIGDFSRADLIREKALRRTLLAYKGVDSLEVFGRAAIETVAHR